MRENTLLKDTTLSNSSLQWTLKGCLRRWHFKGALRSDFTPIFYLLIAIYRMKK